MPSTPPRRRGFPIMPFRGGSSTAQAGLAKIINIIFTVPTPMEVSRIGSDSTKVTTMPAEEAVNLDLRLGLSVQAFQAPVAGASDRNSTAHSGVFDSDGAHTVEKKPIPFNAISHRNLSSEAECSAVDRRSENVGGGKAEASGSGEGYLDLLVEAAMVVSSEGWNHAGDEKASAMEWNTVRRKRSGSSGEMQRSKRARTSSAAAVGFKENAEAPPISRSKRGRALVLPSRYRDSILEPPGKAPAVKRR